jgi:hypothetical protein
MADLHRLLFETPAKVSDREVLATARLNARVKAFAGQQLADDVIDRINEAVADEADRLIAEGVLRERPAGWRPSCPGASTSHSAAEPFSTSVAS